MPTYILFPLGFILLIKGADILIEGASSIAKRLRIPDLVIGMTIVALGSSAPELLVNIMASLNGANEIALTNIIGSNISNILLILGITAIIHPLRISKGTRWKEIPLIFLSVTTVFLMLNDHLVDGATTSAMTRTDGVILLFFFIIFLYYSFGLEQRAEEKTPEIEQKPLHGAILLTILGFIALPVGGQWVVNGATEIAKTLGISEGLIGLTIVAIGSSAPELAASVAAAIKKNADLAIGNIVGSVIFNTFWIFGISAVIRPMELTPTINQDIGILALATAALFFFAVTGKRIQHLIFKDIQQRGLSRTAGITFVLGYLSYLIFLVWRG